MMARIKNAIKESEDIIDRYIKCIEHYNIKEKEEDKLFTGCI
jgi:hypothetical protein